MNNPLASVSNKGSWQSRVRVAVAALALFSLAGCKVALNSNLNEQEANDIVSALAPEGLSATKEQSGEKGWQVMVDESDLAASINVLRANGLPSDRYVSMGDVFQKQGLVSTPSEERMRYIYAVSQELSYTLRKIDGVVEARVHVVIPVNDPLADKIKPSSAAVFIKYNPDVDLRVLVPEVKEFVAHSIEGLTHEGVSLSLFEAHKGVKGKGAIVQRGTASIAGLSSQTWVILLGLLAGSAIAVAVVPTLARKRGLDLRNLQRRPARSR